MRNVKPILMNAAMVQATLREIETHGTGKTQTRRIIKPQPVDTGVSWQFDLKDKRSACFSNFPYEKFNGREFGVVEYCPYGKPGDLLYAKETWTHTGTGVWTTQDALKALDGKIEYRASNDIPGASWFPSIFMFRNFSRITLEITDIKVERLQDICPPDCWAEGIVETDFYQEALEHASAIGGCTANLPHECFQHLWTSINGPESWDANPWVWVVSFKPHLINVDQMIKERAAA